MCVLLRAADACCFLAGLLLMLPMRIAVLLLMLAANFMSGESCRCGAAADKPELLVVVKAPCRSKCNSTRMLTNALLDTAMCSVLRMHVMLLR